MPWEKPQWSNHCCLERFLFLPACCCGLADSDDDNGGGGLRQPVLVPIPVRHHQRCPSILPNPPLRRGFFMPASSGSSVTLAPSLKLRRQRVWGGCSVHRQWACTSTSATRIRYPMHPQKFTAQDAGLSFGIGDDSDVADPRAHNSHRRLRGPPGPMGPMHPDLPGDKTPALAMGLHWNQIALKHKGPTKGVAGDLTISGAMH